MLVIILLATIIEITFSSNGVPHVPFDTSTSDLANLLKSDHFVDKTDIVKSFLQSTRMIIVTAPRRFGKSTNLDIIKRFCEITVDEKGNRVQRNLTENYKLFAENSLNIYKYESFFNHNFGIYPVIYLDFKRLTSSSYTFFIRTLKKLIGETYFNHKYLLHSHNLNEVEQYRFKKFYYSKNRNKLEDGYLFSSVKTLTRLLYKHFNRTECIVLIDEYDGPIQEAIFKSGTELDRIIGFIRQFISTTLKSNDYVERGLITACIRLAPDSGTNNIIHLPFLTQKNFYKFYGFTEEEVKLLLKKQNMLHKFDDVKMWYDGYCVRNSNSNITIYNPFSIVNYLYFKKFDNYWVKSLDVENLETIFLNKKVSTKIGQLLLYKTITILTDDQVEVGHIVKLKNIVNEPQSWELSQNDVDLFIQFMTELGYFNIFFRGKKNIVVEIPNLEIKTEIEKCLYSVSFLKENLNINQKNINFYVNALLELGKNETTFFTFAQSVANLHANLPTMPENERHFQHALCAFPSFSGKFKVVYSEIPVRRKRFDLLVIRNDLIAIIIELKYEDGSGYDALKQIIEKKYYEELKEKYKYLQIKEYILAGLYVTKTKRCDMCYLINTTDIKNSNNVTAFYA